MARDSLIEEVSSVSSVPTAKPLSPWEFRVARPTSHAEALPTSQTSSVRSVTWGRRDFYGRPFIAPWDEERISDLEVRTAIRAVATRYLELSKRVAVLEAGPSEKSLGAALDHALLENVATVDGVDGIIRHGIAGRGVHIFVLAREHGIVDRDALFDAEDDLRTSVPGLEFELVVRAHQGRPFKSVVPGGIVVFER